MIIRPPGNDYSPAGGGVGRGGRMVIRPYGIAGCVVRWRVLWDNAAKLSERSRRKMTEETTVEKTPRKKRSGRRMPRGRVTVFPNWCKGCNLCIEFCPTQVLALGDDGRVIVAHPEKCTGCRWCELHCPDFAIFVTNIEEDEQ